MSNSKHFGQIDVKCRVRPTAVGTETLSFDFFLGPMKVVCICNIPGEGETNAPGYVRLQLPDENGEYPRKAARPVRDLPRHTFQASEEEDDG